MAFAASYGITTIDNTVNSLTAAQLQGIYNNMDALKATAASANATIKGHYGCCRCPLKAANDAVATMNSLLPPVFRISAPTIDTSDSSKIVVSAEVIANNAKDTGSVVAEVPLPPPPTTTPTPALLSAMPPRTVLPLPAYQTVSSAANPITASSGAVIKATGDNTAVVPLLSLLWLLPACSAWPSARSVHCKSSCISPVCWQRAEPLALPVFRCLYGIGQFILVLDLPFI